MLDRYVIALETVVKIPGYSPDLGYTLFNKTITFDTREQAQNVLRELGLPLG